MVSTFNKSNISIYMRVTIVGNGGTGVAYVFWILVFWDSFRYKGIFGGSMLEVDVCCLCR